MYISIIQVRVGYHSGTKPYNIRKCMKPYVKAATRGNLAAIARCVEIENLAFSVPIHLAQYCKNIHRLPSKHLLGNLCG